MALISVPNIQKAKEHNMLEHGAGGVNIAVVGSSLWNTFLYCELINLSMSFCHKRRLEAMHSVRIVTKWGSHRLYVSTKVALHNYTTTITCNYRMLHKGSTSHN